MFITIEPHQFSANQKLLDAMFRLRKRVFFDELGWDVPIKGDRERDRYDAHRPVYLIWCSDDRRTLYASLRLMPTTGPTLLHDVFSRTFGNDVDLSAPGIWEATRMCVDVEALRLDHPEIDLMRAMSLMVALICEVAVDKGIHTVVSNYEPQIARVYKRAGAKFDEIGRADGYGKRPVCCGLFEASECVLQQIYTKLRLSKPLLSGLRHTAQHHAPAFTVNPYAAQARFSGFAA